MKAIMTVVGPDRVGIVAGVTTLLASLNINILDLSQTIMGGIFTMTLLASLNINILDLSQTIMDDIFTMTLLVDTAAANRPFDEIRTTLREHGERENLNIRIQREDTFTAMHRI